jgi:hypothetical protein
MSKPDTVSWHRVLIAVLGLTCVYVMSACDGRGSLGGGAGTSGPAGTSGAAGTSGLAGTGGGAGTGALAGTGGGAGTGGLSGTGAGGAARCPCGQYGAYPNCYYGETAGVPGPLPGTDGAAGTSGNTTWTPPSCLADLFAGCPIDTACTAHPAASGGYDRFCYASGTRAAYAGQFCPLDFSQQVAVTKADGSPCFTLAIGWSSSGDYTWTDPAGNVVATATRTIVSASGGTGSVYTVKCRDTGETSTCDSRQGCRSGSLLFGIACPDGDCP